MRSVVLYGSATALAVAVTIVTLINPALGLGAVAAVAVAAVTVYRPTFGVSIWLIVLVAVPDWTPIPISGFKPVSLVGVVVLMGLYLSRRRRPTKLVVPDVALMVAVALIAIFTALDHYPLWLIANVGGMLVCSYLVGRLAPASAGRAYVFAMLAVSLWGMTEFLFDLHLFETLINPSDPKSWPAIQSRAGFDRSEAALGHAIAYGASLALALPLTSTLSRGRLAAQLILVGGILVSLSRGPLLTMVFTLALLVILMMRGAKRAWGLVGMSVAGALVLFVFEFLSDAEDSTRTALSGEQRLVQFLATVSDVQWVGSKLVRSDGIFIDSLGTTVIDNAFLRLGINYGWVVAVLILSPLIYAAVNLLRHPVPSSVALLGQLPVLAVTSLITQWQAALFFIAGLAVTSIVARKTAANGAQHADVRPVGSMSRVVSGAHEQREH